MSTIVHNSNNNIWELEKSNYKWDIMGYRIEYSCCDCDFELVDDNRLFYYDSTLNETIDYTLVRLTVGLDEGSEIKGIVSKTYCNHCKKYVKVYNITKVENNFENACEILKEGIDNHMLKKIEEIQELIEIEERKKSSTRFKIKCWIHRMNIDDLGIDFKIEFLNKKLKKYLDTVYVVERRKSNYLKKVNCPNCGSEINRYLDKEMPCPKCGGELIFREADVD